MNDVLLVTNSYDAKSRRVRKVTAEATTTFFYDDWNLIEERIAYTNGMISTIHYFWGKDLSGTLQGAGGVGGLLFLTIDGTVYIPCYDNNGNTTRYLNANGSTVAAYTYDAFGNTLSRSGNLADFFLHRFSTRYYDRETGLYYYGYRFYDPALMRWLNRDPIAEDGGLNIYMYCSNGSISRCDALGKSWFSCFGECVEEWRLDWNKIITAMNITLSFDAPVPKAPRERAWIEKGVSKDTTELSRLISKGEHLARKLPLGSPARSNLMHCLGNLRRFMRNPALVRAGIAGAALTVFEGFYDIGVMLYCSSHCCGR